MSDELMDGENASEANTDPGPRLALLAQFEQEPSTDFLGRIRRTLHRRTATSQMAAFFWSVPMMVLIEFLKLFDHIFSPASRNPRKGQP